MAREPDVGLPNPQEMAAIAGFVAELDGRWRLTFTVEGGSEWLLVDGVRTDAHYAGERHSLRLALWRFTLAVYPYESADSEAVAEDPITPEEFAREFAGGR